MALSFSLSRSLVLPFSRNALISSKYTLVYLPIPKCASASLIVWWWRLHGSPHLDTTRFHLACKQKWGFPGSVPHTLSPTLKEHYAFAVVRDPWSRLVSIYAEKIIGKRPLTALAPLYKRFGKSVSFHTFVAWLSISPRKSWDEHWRSCSDHLQNHELYKLWLMKDVVENVNVLHKRFGVDVPLIPYNVTHYTTDKGACVADIPATDFAPRGVPSWRRFYDRKLWDTVADLYSDDVELLALRTPRDILSYADTNTT